MSDFVIGPGQDDLVLRMLSTAQLPAGARFVTASILADRIVATYSRAGNTLLRIELRHPHELPDDVVPAGRTRSFGVVAPAADAGGAAIVAAVVDAVRQGEGGFRWKRALAALAENPEWLAFRTGIKPALRVLAEPERAGAEAELLREMGAAVRELDAEVELEGGPRRVLYAARTEEAAEELRDLEAPLLSDDRLAIERRVDLTRRLGLRLGYPTCCVEAFAGRVARGLGVLASGTEEPTSELFAAVDDAWVPHPVVRLNDLLRAESRFIIGFTPCRYDCAHAHRLADGVAWAMEEAWGTDAVTLLDRTLAVDVAVSSIGGRALVVVKEGRVAAARAPSERPEDRELAATLTGRALDESGTISEPAKYLIRIVRFRSGRHPS